MKKKAKTGCGGSIIVRQYRDASMTIVEDTACF